MVGHKFDQEAIDKLSKRIGSELHRKVEHRVEKGTQPEHVKVVYDAPRSYRSRLRMSPSLPTPPKQGFTGALQTDFDLAGLRVHAGMQIGCGSFAGAVCRLQSRSIPAHR